ncbi:hypothetical protein CR513_43550, partial [Mucuna pruriens]
MTYAIISGNASTEKLSEKRNEIIHEQVMTIKQSTNRVYSELDVWELIIEMNIMDEYKIPPHMSLQALIKVMTDVGFMYFVQGLWWIQKFMDFQFFDSNGFEFQNLHKVQGLDTFVQLDSVHTSWIWLRYFIATYQMMQNYGHNQTLAVVVRARVKLCTIVNVEKTFLYFRSLKNKLSSIDHIIYPIT